jgi:hypothetical protein
MRYINNVHIQYINNAYIQLLAAMRKQKQNGKLHI